MTTAPKDLSQASRYCRNLACAAYRIGENSALIREAPPALHGGVLVLIDKSAPPIKDPDALCDAVVRECSRRWYQGVLLDFEESPCSDRTAFALRLEKALALTNRTLYLPESYSAGTKQAVILISTAISGGTLADRLRDAAKHYGGAHRLALDVQRVQMDFCLPCPSGEGTPLTDKALRILKEQEQPATFFSSELCARYFTYKRERSLHFVLLDDAETMGRKLRLGTSLGFRAAFFVWPEVAAFAGKLFR